MLIQESGYGGIVDGGTIKISRQFRSWQQVGFGDDGEGILDDSEILASMASQPIMLLILTSVHHTHLLTNKSKIQNFSGPLPLVPIPLQFLFKPGHFISCRDLFWSHILLD